MKRTSKTEKKKGIKTSSAKAKGRKLQQWFGQKVADITGFAFGKDEPIESRPMGQSGVDLRMEKVVLSVFPFSVECKAGNSAGLWGAIKQAKENQIKGTDWLVCLRRDRMEPIVAMDAELFFLMVHMLLLDNGYNINWFKEERKLQRGEE